MKKPVLLVNKDICFKLISQKGLEFNVLQLFFNYFLSKEIHRMHNLLLSANVFPLLRIFFLHFSFCGHLCISDNLTVPILISCLL